MLTGNQRSSSVDQRLVNRSFQPSVNYSSNPLSVHLFQPPSSISFCLPPAILLFSTLKKNIRESIYPFPPSLAFYFLPFLLSFIPPCVYPSINSFFHASILPSSHNSPHHSFPPYIHSSIHPFIHSRLRTTLQPQFPSSLVYPGIP